MAGTRPAGSTAGRALRPGAALSSEGHGFARGRVNEIQRGRIILALVQAACPDGVRALSVTRIVQGAGVSRRTFYELFADSEECFLAAFDYSIERFAARVVPAYQAEGRWQDRIRAGLLALLELLDEDPCMGRLVFVEALAAGPQALARRAHVLETLVAVVEEGSTASGARATPSPLTGEGVVGAVCSVLHARLVVPGPVPFVRLTNQLTSLIVQPYLGAAATRAELRRPAPRSTRRSVAPDPDGDLIKRLGMRITYRTARVLMAVAESPGASNRTIGARAGVSDQGQISKLLGRLQRLGLTENNGGTDAGMSNAWHLTERGRAVERLVGASSPIR